MKVDTTEIKFEDDKSIQASLDSDIKYCLDVEKDNIFGLHVLVSDKPRGFVIFSKAKSSFYPGNAILQFSLDDECIGLKKEIWQILYNKCKIDSAMATTENLAALAVFQINYKHMRPLAVGFEHGSNVQQVALPNGLKFAPVRIEQLNEILSVWREIYSFFKLEYVESEGDVKRTSVQIRNGDVFALYAGESAIGLGVANFKYSTNGRVEIAYAVKPEHWRKGYGTLIASYLKMECQKRKYISVAKCDIENFPSYRVLQKSGMVCRSVKLEYIF
jgi:GNAT superfamily N-acetyltransferase